jgi:ankyrin repeat protein
MAAIVRSDSNDNDALREAVIYGDTVKCLDLIKREGIDVNSRLPGWVSWQHGWTALHFSVSRKNPEMIKILLDLGADVNAQDSEGLTPLHRAVYLKCDKACELLLEYGASLSIRNPTNNTAMDCALIVGGKHVIALLRKHEQKLVKTASRRFDLLVLFASE